MQTDPNPDRTIRLGPGLLDRQSHSVATFIEPFPDNGTTTACEALLMSVPVVSLAGDSHASRVGLSLLRSAGVPQFAAQSRGRVRNSRLYPRR
ncbi:MAG: hypothetical protein MUE97_02190 [Phycisphaerales bacterium]|nr:hypothetical protein [Phycisphaerales bacterium]